MELNAYFKSLVDQDRAAVVICDLEHTIIYMNPAAIASYAKHGGAALLGKSVLTCHNPQSRQTIQRVIDWPPTKITTLFTPTTTSNRTRTSTWSPCGTPTAP